MILESHIWWDLNSEADIKSVVARLLRQTICLSHLVTDICERRSVFAVEYAPLEVSHVPFDVRGDGTTEHLRALFVKPPQLFLAFPRRFKLYTD
jgi:hypothetical protein